MKRALIKQIVVVILVILCILIVISGITAYQVSKLIKTTQSELPQIKLEADLLMAGDCSKISSIETRISNLELEATSACKNPIIRMAIERIDEIPIKCNNLQRLKQEAQGNLTLAKQVCDMRSQLNL